ncbi:MAG: DUF1365 domain-containing protein [Gemmatimonadota bacterium]|nr:DUF1365 domain-containing protein [Gemmatimonadota bacterium]
MKSALYFGRVRHRRHEPVGHHFSQRLFMVYLDLSELDEVFRGRWLWSTGAPSVAWFRRADYLGDSGRPLDDTVRDTVERTGRARPGGPIRMLTHLRYFGYIQNPVTFYYCFEADGSGVETVVAEVTNTPWGERHAYVVDFGGLHDADDGAPGSSFPKGFHVSPFMSMEQEYRWRFSTPGPDLTVHMESFEEDRRIFDATLTLERRAITAPALAGALLRFPWMTAGVLAGIYTQAARVWLKGAPFHAHPERGER